MLLCNPSNELVVESVGKDPEAVRRLFQWLDQLDPTKLGEAKQQFAHCKRIDLARLTGKSRGLFIKKLSEALKVDLREVAPIYYKQKKIDDLR